MVVIIIIKYNNNDDDDDNNITIITTKFTIMKKNGVFVYLSHSNYVLTIDAPPIKLGLELRIE